MNIKTMYMNLKIRNKLFVVFSSVLVLYALFGVVLIERMFVVYNQNLYQQASSELNLMSELVDRALQEAETFSFQTATSLDVQNELKTINSSSNYQSFLMTQSLYRRLNALLEEKPYLSNLMVVTRTGAELLVGSYGTSVQLSSAQMQALVAAAGQNVWLLNPNQAGFITSAREIREVNNLSLGYMGALVMQIDVKSLVNDYVHLSNGEAFVVMKGNQVVYSGMPDLNVHLTGLQNLRAGQYRVLRIGARQYFVTHLQSTYDSFGFYNVIPYNNRFTIISRLRYEMLGLYILLFLVSEFAALQLAKRMSRPIEIVTQEMRDVHDGKSSLANARTTKSLGMDEIGTLYEEFHALLERIDHLIQENYAKELLVVRTELKALQAQINPHFLYNTLNSINWIARMNKQETISEMIEALSNMFRTMMDQSTTVITVGEEINLAQDYLKIQKIRFGDRLQVEFDVDVRTLECSIPKLSIQPIVENSIRHGLEQMIEPCAVSVSCFVSGNDLIIRVTDNGPGIDPGSVDQILSVSADESIRSRIGLANIHKRIVMMYGADYGVSIRSGVNQGTQVALRLPFQS